MTLCAGRLWHKLTTDEQSKYYEQAKRVKEEHMRRYPTWSARDNYATRVSRSKRVRLVQNVAGGAGAGLSGLSATCASGVSCSYASFYAGGGSGSSSGSVSACGSCQGPGVGLEPRIGSADMYRAAGFGLRLGAGPVRGQIGSSEFASLGGRGPRTNSPPAGTAVGATAADLIPPLAAPIQTHGFAFARS